MSTVGSLLGGGVVNSIEKIALEYIETDKETAEAKCMLVKVLDPNGKLRRDLSRFACKAYGSYLAVALLLTLAHAFGLTNPEQSREAIDAITELFLPITASWASIVGASFGVNAANTIKNG